MRLAFFIAIAAAACGGDSATATEDSPGVVRVMFEYSDSTISVGDSTPLTAVAFDSAGARMPSFAARWTSSDGRIVDVSANGVARAKALGIARVRATIGRKFAEQQICVHRKPAQAVIEAGDGQTALILSEAPVLPVVRFVDAAGAPVSCLRVEVDQHGAEVSPAVSLTDADGRVRVTKWRIAPTAGMQTISFGARPDGDVFASVHMIGTPGPPATLSGPADMTNPGYFGQSLGQFTVQVRDIGNNLLTGIPVSFTAVGAKPSLSASNLATNQIGATIGIRLDTVGTSTIQATVAGLSPFVFRVSATGFRAKAIVMGGHRACATTTIVTTKASYCWGYERARPAGLGADLTSLTIGTAHLCALGPAVGFQNAGCWGGNESGELGIGYTSPPPPGFAVDTIGFPPMTPSLTVGLYGIFAGFGNTCALAAQEMWCWGSNANGAFGDPALRAMSVVPIRSGTSPHFMTLQMNRTSICGIDDRSVTYCWGRNGNGQLGDGTNIDRWTATRVASPTPFVSLSGGCALTADGTAYCWGANSSGHVGDGTTVDRLVPAPVSGGLRFRSISTGNRINCGLAVSGRVYCWGNGQLAPREVTLPNGRLATAVATAEASVCAVDTADELFCWGENAQHELGDGTTINRAIPVPVMPVAAP